MSDQIARPESPDADVTRRAVGARASYFRAARWSFVLGAFFVAAAIGAHFILQARSTPSDPYVSRIPIALGAVAVLFLVAGFGILRRRNWARVYSMWLWGLGAIFVAALGLFSVWAMILVGVDLAREEWQSAGLTFGLVLGVLLGTLVMLGGIVSFLVLWVLASTHMRYFRSDEAKRACSETPVQTTGPEDAGPG